MQVGMIDMQAINRKADEGSKHPDRNAQWNA
jgi:hypothetical protein